MKLEIEIIKKRIGNLEAMHSEYVPIWPPESGLAFCYWQTLDEDKKALIKSSIELYNYISTEYWKNERIE